MAVREILKMGDPRLLRVARPVERFGTPELRELIDDMFETMTAAGGVGLAAPGNPIERTAEGFHARVVQHECDHLIGVLYPMRIRDMRKFGFTEVLFPGSAPAED